MHRVDGTRRGIFSELIAEGRGGYEQRLCSRWRSIVARGRSTTNDLRDHEGRLDDWKAGAALGRSGQVGRLRGRDRSRCRAGRGTRGLTIGKRSPPAKTATSSRRNHPRGNAQPLDRREKTNIRHGSHPADRHREAAIVRLRDSPRSTIMLDRPFSRGQSIFSSFPCPVHRTGAGGDVAMWAAGSGRRPMSRKSCRRKSGRLRPTMP